MLFNTLKNPDDKIRTTALDILSEVLKENPKEIMHLNQRYSKY